ncbi:TetR family transcriptional regulator [Dactylosporangium sp. NPDC049140]|jgi:AcrR family transcriptional regulator|uniref:TetR/AcrR family transcriptional regulator n=1 Tax=Dactylosporangium sp. NPDC049140 TaxID=3155647 RepID=UPI0033D02B21
MSRPISRRARQAAETRRDILDAALRLFAGRGYAATAIADIAAEAGVAVPTVYASVGAKPLLLKGLLKTVDIEAGVPELAQALGAATDPREVLRLGVRITRQVAERGSAIIKVLASAAGSEPEMGQAYAEGLAKHGAGAAATVGRIAALGALSADVSEPDAVAIFATLTGTPVYDGLTGHGWSYDKCETWLLDTLAAQLLRSPGKVGRTAHQRG